MNTHLIILLHGMNKNKRSLVGLHKYLEKQHYRVLSVEYPSRNLSLTELVEFIHHKLSDLKDKYKKISFIGCAPSMV